MQLYIVGSHTIKDEAAISESQTKKRKDYREVMFFQNFPIFLAVFAGLAGLLSAEQSDAALYNRE